QLFGRPAWRRVPYATPARGIYLCSSSTPPGGGVHGMSGYYAARTVLRREFGIKKLPNLAPLSN
ncbi:MAG TPA: dehydrogenase, partial [Mycobacterium sp.]|nr:dehydrogenase [Mycobacterium sp.]